MSSRTTYRPHAMSVNHFMRLMAACTLVECVMVAVFTAIAFNWKASILLIIVTLVVAIGAICLFHFSDTPWVSFSGVTIMSAALGAMIGPYVAQYESVIIIQALVITGLVTTVMCVLATIFPHFFTKLGGILMAGLVVLLIGLFAEAILLAIGIPFEHMETADTVLLWAGILIFTGFIGYDWGKALENRPYTLDKAIDASGGLVLDIVNFFIRALAVLGGRTSSD